MKLLQTLFPIKLQLTILQIEEYKFWRFLGWVFRNYFKRNVLSKRDIAYTWKLRVIIKLMFVWFLMLELLVFLILGNWVWNVFVGLFLLADPYILIGLAMGIIKPYEIVNKWRIIRKTRNKILDLKEKGLKVIAITGSYGKTSTKEFLYQLIKDEARVLRSPESFNTLFGLSMVVDYELDESYEYFIVEMAAYIKGEIAELCYMIPPDYGLITGIAPQHLEKFGSMESIVSAKFELFDFINETEKFMFNLDDKQISDELKRRGKLENAKGYIKDKFETDLFGSGSKQNVLAALSLGSLVGFKKKKLLAKVKNLKPIANRYVVRKAGKASLVDNTYSSNLVTFRNTLLEAKKLKGAKALVTPGLVELGKDEKQIHIDLGSEARGIFDEIILVGKNARTKAFEMGLSGNEKVKLINDNREEYFAEINRLSKKMNWIFLENDVTQNY